MIAIDYTGYILLFCLYLYVLHKLNTLYVANYNKVQLLFYLAVLIIIVTITCYTIYASHYDIFLLILIVIANSLIVAYDRIKK